MDSTDKLRKKNPCTRCGSKLIDCKTNVIQIYDYGAYKIEAYCYCDNCGFRGPSITNIFKDQDEAVGKAFSLWNQYMQQ